MDGLDTDGVDGCKYTQEMDCGGVDPILNGLVTFQQPRDARKACATGLMGGPRVGFVIEIERL